MTASDSAISLWQHRSSVLLGSEIQHSLWPLLCQFLCCGLSCCGTCPVAELCTPPSLQPSLPLPSCLLRRRISQQVDKRQNRAHFKKKGRISASSSWRAAGLGITTGGSRSGSIHCSNHVQSSRLGGVLTWCSEKWVDHVPPTPPHMIPPGGHQSPEQVVSGSFVLWATWECQVLAETRPAFLKS